MEEITTIGIDLGTTYSCAAIWRNGNYEIIPCDGNRTLPSVVLFNLDNTREFGVNALNQSISKKKHFIFDSKRLLGRTFLDKDVQSDLNRWPFKVISQGNMPVIQIDVAGNDNKSVIQKKYTPEEISAMILGQIKSAAEKYLAKPINDAVITVPAYFNDAQRKATINAGKIAGLNIKRIINEPTAAAMAYGLDKQKEKKIFLVYDLGGGTLDVSLISLEDSIIEVITTSGDTHLGGQDFTNNLINYCIAQFKTEHGIDLTNNPNAKQRLFRQCEAAKIKLSNTPNACIKVLNLAQELDLELEMPIEKFELINQTLFKRCIAPLEEVFKNFKENLDEVIIVGGSTKMPKIQSQLKDYFKTKFKYHVGINNSLNPDEAIAAGAAIQAGILCGAKEKNIKDLILLDVTPLSLGIEIKGMLMSTIIKKSTNIPTKKSQSYTTSSDLQTSVKISVFEGERTIVTENNQLGSFIVNNIPPLPEGKASIEVTFELDNDSVLTVTAVDKTIGGSSSKNSLVVKSEERKLTANQISSMIAEAEKLYELDLEKKKRIIEILTLEQYLKNIEKALNGKPANYDNLRKLVKELLSWINKYPQYNATLEETEKQKKLLLSHNNLITQLGVIYPQHTQDLEKYYKKQEDVD